MKTREEIRKELDDYFWDSFDLDSDVVISPERNEVTFWIDDPLDINNVEGWRDDGCSYAELVSVTYIDKKFVLTYRIGLQE